MRIWIDSHFLKNMFDLFRWFLLLVDWKFVAIFWKQKMCLTTYKRARAIKGAVLCCRVRAHSSLWGSLGRKAARQVTRPKKETSRTLNLYSPLSLLYIFYLPNLSLSIWNCLFHCCVKLSVLLVRGCCRACGECGNFCAVWPVSDFRNTFFCLFDKRLCINWETRNNFQFIRSLAQTQSRQKGNESTPPFKFPVFFSLPRIHIQRSRLSLSVNSNHFLADDRMMRFKYNRRKK